MVITPDFQSSKHAKEASALLEAFSQFGGIQETSTIREWLFENHPGLFSVRSVGQYLRGCSVNAPIAISWHKDFPRFLYKHGHGQFELYDPEKHGLFDEAGYKDGQKPMLVDISDELEEELSDAIEASNQFAYEAHLRDYLSRNLQILEKGLTLWSGAVLGSVEYQLSDGRRIDILAKDSAGIPVVIELKLSKGHAQTIGQALYYRGKLRQEFGLPKVRIILVAGEIKDELRIAAAEVADVELYSYELTMAVTKIVS